MSTSRSAHNADPSSRLPAWLIALTVGLLALALHALLIRARAPIVAIPSVAILALVGGLAMRNSVLTWLTVDRVAILSGGFKGIVKGTIPPAIVLLGAGLDLRNIANPSVGVAGLCITVACMAIAFGAAYLCSRLLALSSKTAALIGAGTAVCGNSAIVAVAPLVRADDEDLVLSLGTINLVGLVATLALPPVAIALATPDQAAGIWMGTSVHAIPQAVAAGDAISPEAGELATLFKLVRVAMLAPMVALFALVAARQDARSSTRPRLTRLAGLVPWFIWGFLGMSLLNTLGLLGGQLPPIGLWTDASGTSPTVAAACKWMGRLLLIVAMAAVGLDINVRSMLSVGVRALLAGLVAGVVLAASSLGLILALM